MEYIIIQSRAAFISERSKFLYFFAHIFHYLFRCKRNNKAYFPDCYLGNSYQKYFSKKPTLPFISVIVGFFLCRIINKHFIYTFNF